MRKKIAAANWKMNLTLQEGEQLITEIIKLAKPLATHQLAVFAVPYPYLSAIKVHTATTSQFLLAAQNCAQQQAGAYTGEVSAAMLHSLGIPYVLIGHSERRAYQNETNEILAQKINIALANNLLPIFCCGEPLTIREQATQNEYVAQQLQDSLFHLAASQLLQVAIAYEPIWAIGTGLTATSEQAQQMHAHIRQTLATKYGLEVANSISILYGGSVKASNAAELFEQPDVDGGLVGGASLQAAEFAAIINSLP